MMLNDVWLSTRSFGGTILNDVWFSTCALGAIEGTVCTTWPVKTLLVAFAQNAFGFPANTFCEI